MEDEVKQNNVLGRDDGNILIMSVVIVALLVATGMGYMRWASDEKWDSEYERATIQAYFVAQTGLIERGLTFLRTREPADLPQATVQLLPGEVPGVGIHFNNMVSRVPGAEGNVFQRTDSYDLYSTGRVNFWGRKYAGRGGLEQIPVDRTATMRARLRSFANYMYLTNREVTEYNEIIWFWTPDTLYGRTHSNDYIGLKYSPQFYGPVSTSKPEFRYYQPQNIYFEYPPVFNAPIVEFPKTAKSIRSAAQPFISDHNGTLMTLIKLVGDGGIKIYQYRLGSDRTQVNDEDNLISTLPVPNWQAIFVDGQCEVEGVLAGSLTIGSSGNMWLIDDVRYLGANPRTGDFDEASMNHMLGLVSEANVIIEDNYKNGKAGGYQGGVAPFPAEPNNWERHSIVLNAGIVALGSSFTFEHQNDEWEAYQGPTPDERGHIYLKGAVTQERRGYVHRSNHTGTGYGKAYRYDFRFDRRPPPYYMEALDENGHGLFDIISWGEQRPRKP
jgi:hypothetical protein